MPLKTAEKLPYSFIFGDMPKIPELRILFSERVLAFQFLVRERRDKWGRQGRVFVGCGVLKMP